VSKDYKKGDANCDGGVDMSDVVIIMQALASPNKYGVNGSDKHHITLQGQLNGDVDISSKGLTSNDALEIQKYLLGTSEWEQ
jgi:mannan endo-1,4-beta-mannosidase